MPLRDENGSAHVPEVKSQSPSVKERNIQKEAEEKRECRAFIFVLH